MNKTKIKLVDTEEIGISRTSIQNNLSGLSNKTKIGKWKYKN